MAKYRPDIKPPMWGPPDAVRYAVRANAERMGIDYSEISVFLATWEGGGNALYGPVGGPYAMGSGCQWSSVGLYTNGSSSGVIDLGNITIGSGVATIIQRVMCDSSNVFSLSSRSGATSAGYEFLLGYGGVAGRARLRWQDSSSHFSTTIGDISGLNDGKYHSLCVQFTQDVGRFYADGTLIASDSRNGELNNSQNCFIAKRGTTYMQGHPNDTLLIARNSFTEDQIAQLHATPYALLMPVSRPVYFDLGAGGGITFSASCGSTLSSSDIQAFIVRSLAASAAASLTSSDIAVTTAASYLLSAACHASVSSSDILTSILRDMAADASASTTSSNILAAVARILIASADGSLTGSDIAVSIAAQKIFEAACNASLQSSDILASILRQVQAQCDSRLTGQDVILAILRQLVASCAGSLTASDITVSTVAQKLFQAACAASLTASDSALNVTRTLSCNCNGVVSSSDATLTIAGLITFLAECTASLSGSDVTASIARVLSAESLSSVSSSDIAVTNLVALAATCDSTVSAADIALNLQMYLQAICDGTLSADDASVSVAALLSASCGATISSSDIRVLFTDEFMLPEVFAAISKITKAYEAESLVTKTFDARSRIEIRRLN